MKYAALGIGALGLAAIVSWITWSLEQDITQASARARSGSTLVDTPCGPIEYQAAGQGTPLLVVHGSGGGHDQGMAYARALTRHGIRVIAMSRFGYLRTPRPADASPQAQADAHICLLDALAIPQAAVLGVSAGAPSAMQAAIRHPTRVDALALVVPIAFRPQDVAASAPHISDRTDAMLMRLLGSDLLFWAALKLAREQVIRHVLATPPELLAAADPQEKTRVDQLADAILPVSLRAAGLRDDTRLGKSLGRFALASIQVPTLLVSARDDGFGTYAAAQYTASQIPGARFLGFDDGGHLLVGHDATVRAAIVQLLQSRRTP